MVRLFAALAAAALAAGCASVQQAPVTPALFVVIPSSDGHVGEVVVRRCGQSQEVNVAYGGQRLDADGSVRPVQLTEAQIRRDFGPTLDALPSKPATFLLYFREGSDELTERSREALEEVFAELRRRPLPDIMVIGHTDTVGGDAYNDQLSRSRADRMRELLISRGLPGERIEAAGRGKREPLVRTADNMPEPRNRRVEISVR